jgi:hypothetical protein
MVKLPSMCFFAKSEVLCQSMNHALSFLQISWAILFVISQCRAPEIDMSELENLFSAALPISDHGRKSMRGSVGPKSDKVQLVIKFLVLKLYRT